MKNKPILIVEDNMGDQYLINMAFKKAKIENELVMAKNGDEALEILKQKDFTPFIIISDVKMPGMDGFELKRNIDKDPNLEAKAVPFIFMSSSILEKDVKEAFKIHSHGYFPKQDFEDQTKVIDLITKYWNESELPGVNPE
jgi:CheY-like chemotaxis protein